MKKYENTHHCEPLINSHLTAMGITVNDFVHEEMVQYSLFEDNIRKDKIRKTTYEIKDKFGSDKIMRAMAGVGFSPDPHNHNKHDECCVDDQ